MSVALAVFAVGGCSMTALVGRNRSDTDGDAAVDDAFTPADLGAPSDVIPAPDVIPTPDVRPVPDVIRTVDAVVDLDAGVPPMDARDPGDSEARPLDLPRAEAALVGLDVAPADAAKGIDAGPMEERPAMSCLNDRDCSREAVASRCDLALSRCVPR